MASTTIIILMLFFTQGTLGHVLQQSPIVGIAGGHPVDIEDAPFMAALSAVDRFTNKTYFMCGGSIIHQQFVLTAAHCILFRITPYIVRVGSSQPSDGKMYEVDKYIFHDKFTGNYKNAGFDVGLLKLSEPLTLSSSVKIIKLADEIINIPIGFTANVTGWGDTEMIGWPKNLLQASVSVSPAADCTQNFTDGTIQINDTLQICAKDKHRGSCQGDSGGPLTAGDRQIGIASAGSTCRGYANVFVKVAPHLQWIDEKINENLLQ